MPKADLAYEADDVLELRAPFNGKKLVDMRLLLRAIYR